MEEEIHNIDMLPQPASSDLETDEGEEIQEVGGGEVQKKGKEREVVWPPEEKAKEKEQGDESEGVVQGTNQISSISPTHAKSIQDQKLLVTVAREN